MITRLTTLVTIVTLLAAAGAGAAVYTGSLTSLDGGIVATPYWEDVTLEWTVTQLADLSWRYSYDLLVSQGAGQLKDISHILIETSPQFTEMGDILWTNWAPISLYTDDVEVQQWTSQQGNPNLPGTLYGVKFNAVSPLPSGSTGTHWLVEFTSPRAPVWGDFYAKDGQTPGGAMEITAWNAGILLPDPLDAPADGSISNKILRPDTDTTVIPEMSAPALASLAGLIPALGVALRRRR